MGQLYRLKGPVGQEGLRVGFTGAPGVGKSTLIEKFGLFLVDNLGAKLAVLVGERLFVAPREAI